LSGFTTLFPSFKNHTSKHIRLSDKQIRLQIIPKTQTLKMTIAGGFVGDFSGRDKYLETGNVVAGNEQVHLDVAVL
jgi:hypothetical protein